MFFRLTRSAICDFSGNPGIEWRAVRPRYKTAGVANTTSATLPIGLINSEPLS